MSHEVFFQKIKTYTELSPQAEAAWAALLHENTYNKGDNFVTEGQTPKKVAFIVNGLMYQYFSAENGDMVVKYFFPENRIAGSMTATLTQSPSNFTIKALEDTDVLEYNFMEFKKLVAIYPDIAAFYIRYKNSLPFIRISSLFISAIWSSIG